MVKMKCQLITIELAAMPHLLSFPAHSLTPTHSGGVMEEAHHMKEGEAIVAKCGNQ